MCSCAVPRLTVLHPLGCTAPGLPSICSERLQTTAMDLTASTSRRPPRTSPPDDRHGEHLQTTATDLTATTSRRPPWRAPPSTLLKQDTIYFNTGDFFSSLTQISVAYLLPYWAFLRRLNGSWPPSTCSSQLQTRSVEASGSTIRS
ncbi:unnamed protein product [Arctogadus glacialis]